MPRPDIQMGPYAPLPGRQFDAAAYTKSITEAIKTAVRAATVRTQESAIEDAPVRDVFKHGSSYRRRGLRRRTMSLAEARSEDDIRHLLKMKPAATPPYGSAPARVMIRTRGRRFTADPYLRRAATRAGNPNAFDPFIAGRQVIGGRQVAMGRLRSFPRAGERGDNPDNPYEDSVLSARGRYELRGRKGTREGARMNALYTPKARRAGTTLGGRLRGEIHTVGPHLVGSIIKARVVSPTYYAKYQEFGTRHNRATPYMRPAIAKLQSTYRNEVVKALNNLNWKAPRTR